MSHVTDSPEQDVGDGDVLPTYEKLAESHGPNSRFGRWKSWIEKRAAERYVDVTPEEWQRRRQRGWGDDPLPDPPAIPEDRSSTSTPRPSNSFPREKYIDPRDRDLPSLPIEPDEPLEYDPSLPIVGESLRPVHLSLHQFGSRFLPHTTSPIHALLPLLGGRILLIGHQGGLSVLNVFPQEWTNVGLRTKGPGDALAHPIWTGESVFQMSLLEVEEIGESTPQGVVLFLVGSDLESGKDQESNRALRMYNLASLISLAKWTISQNGARPLNLHRPPNWHPPRSRKRKPSGNLAKGLRLLMIDTPEVPEPQSPYQPHRHVSPPRPSSIEATSSSLHRISTVDSGWDFVDDLPLRWATDYVPLAVPGSRLMNASISTYAFWRNDDLPRGSALLAVAIKSAVLLYESPKGERAFRFVKEFYTPLLPRSITFVFQNVPESLSRTVSESSSYQSRETRSDPRQSSNSLTVNPQLCLFIVFEKKAVLVRLINSAVGEVNFFEDGQSSPRDTLAPPGLAGLSARRSRNSFDGFGVGTKDNRASWTLPAKLDLLPSYSSRARTLSGTDPWDAGMLSSPAEDVPAPRDSVYFLTRGKQTFMLPYPLPANLQSTVPLLTVTWRSYPTYVSPRIIKADDEEGTEAPLPPLPPAGLSAAGRGPSHRYKHILQLTAFGEDGLEVQEASLYPLFSLSGRGGEKARAEEPVVSEVAIGETGFLCLGGHWHRPFNSPLDLSRSYSMRSAVSIDTMATEEVVSRLESDQGMYGWQSKGLEDWRIFWIGGVGEEQRTGET